MKDELQTIETDHVVVAYGIVPDNTLAKASGISVDDAHGGFVVNEQECFVFYFLYGWINNRFIDPDGLANTIFLKA